ncbi:unnamed protein product [Heterobilharzia americana]|nr:unnamed protein product [Heterobilharzia americana]
MNNEINRDIPSSSVHITRDKMSHSGNATMYDSTTTTTTTTTTSTFPRYQGRTLNIADEWIQATEARYDSMENLLQSVRRDIDVLTERINQTTPTSPELVRSIKANSITTTKPMTTTTGIINKHTVIEKKSPKPSTKSLPPLLSNQTDLSDDLRCMNEKRSSFMNDTDEFMDIRIRSMENSFHRSGHGDQINEEDLLDCDFVHQVVDNSTSTTTSSSSYDHIEGERYLQKTWRSPSDFSLHDPFYENSFTTFNPHVNVSGIHQNQARHFIKVTGKYNEFVNTDEGGEDEEGEGDEIPHCDLSTHDHHSIIETDLDDYQPDKQENSTTESESSSISPAISPTFSNFVSDEVKLHNIIISNDDTITFPINTNYSRNNNSDNNNDDIDNDYSSDNNLNKTINSDDFQLYDNGHSLTTIDEASEENDDDWSSSEHEASINEGNNNNTLENKQHLSKRNNNNNNNNNNRGFNSTPAYSRHNQLSSNQSISQEFKLSSNDITSQQYHIIRQAGQVEAIRLNLENNRSHKQSFIFQEKDITTSESDLQTPEIIILRPKKTDNSTENNGNFKSRPLSADILHNTTSATTTTSTAIINNNKNLHKSHSGSLVSMLSTISQESVISEADSYVTVCSRLIGTGSEEAYTTAQSDSDGFIDRTLYADSCTDNDDCQTLSRKKSKSLHHRNQKHKINTDQNTDSQSASDIEDDEGEGDTIPNESTLTTSMSVTVVTPKFTKLPSKLTAFTKTSSESNDNVNVETSYIVDGNHTNKRKKTGRSYEELTVSIKNESNETEDTDKKEILSVPYKRVALKRPNRPSDATNLLIGTLLNSDSENECNDSAPSSPSSTSSSTSSSNSDELNEAHYDTSQPESWVNTNFKQLGGIIVPNTVYRPNLHIAPNERKIKRLSKIVETSQTSLTDDNDKDNHSIGTSDDNFSNTLNTNNKINPSSSTFSQKEEAVVVVPKFSNTYLPPLPTNVFKSDTFKQELINKNTRALTQSDNSLVENNEPVTPGVQHNNVNDHQNIVISNQRNQKLPISCLNKHKENSEQQQLERDNNNNLEKDEETLTECEKENYSSTHVKNVDDYITRNIETPKSHEIILEEKAVSVEKESNEKEIDVKQTEKMYNDMRITQKSRLSPVSSFTRKEHFFPKHLTNNEPQLSVEAKSDQRHNGYNPTTGNYNTQNAYTSNLYDNSLTESLYKHEKLQSSLRNSCQNEHGYYSGYEKFENNTSLKPINRILRVSDETKFSKPHEMHMEHFNEHVYDNELDEYNRLSRPSNIAIRQSIPMASTSSSSIFAKSPFIVEDRTRRIENSSSLLQEKEVSTKTASFETINEPISDHHRTQLCSPTVNFARGDIQLASQRKSRILQGDGGNLNYSVSYIPGPILPNPQMPQKTFVDNQSISKLGESKSLKENETKVVDVTGRSTDEETNVCHLYESVSVKDETRMQTTNHDEINKSPGENLCLSPSSQSYKIDTSVNVENEESYRVSIPKENTQSSLKSRMKVIHTPIDFSYKQRQMSPSPPRQRHILLPPSSITSKPPSQYLQRTKWHLKPIPTDEEIRERLRSSSRKRYEERQSRSIQNSQPITYRPRSSRSDSRYRFTDIDSAIAQSKLDTNEAVNQLTTESESHSEARQSASLFDLDAQIQKAYSPILPNDNKINHIDKISMKKSLGDAKSYSSLLETDIDTGENFQRSIILETDLDKLNTQINDKSFDTPLIDTYQDRTRSLYNLTFSNTPGSFRRQKSNDFNGSVTTQQNEITLIQSSNDKQWEKAKSYQGLVNNKENEVQKSQCHYEIGKNKRKSTNSGAQGLIDRLKEKARSTHELRVAQSLTKLHIPEWLDKANCLQTSDIITSTGKESRSEIKQSNEKYFPNTMYTPRSSKSVLSSLRSLSNTCKSNDNLQLTTMNSSLKIIETSINKTKTEQNNHLRPIQSKLNNSMRSLLNGQRYKPDNIQDIEIQITPKYNRNIGQGKLIELNPQDFIPKYEQRWNKEKLNQFNRATTEPLEVYNNQISLMHTSSYLNDSQIKISQYDTINNVKIISSPSIYTKNSTSILNIKDVDHDSVKNLKNEISIENDLSVDNSEIINISDKILNNEFYSVDAEGESESEVTDGFDQISDLTCLTSLLDTCSSRHRSLLVNRPSALEHLLISVGWWPIHPEAEHHYLPPTAAEAISIAAHEFDVKDDSHRYEYLQFISGPNSYKPLNLGEFGLNQLSGGIARHPVDGLLYISCGRSTCLTKPVPVSQASKWCACANCFTLYCSSKCREECEKNPHDHPLNCSFSRAKRVCNRLLRNLAPGQLTGLTALAKTGMARLGRGGILLSFSLIKHAEIFLQRSLEHSFINEQLDDASTEKAVQKWEKFHQPSPGGLMAPPTYLTLGELQELDSTIANPCRSYNPSLSMVLIVVVCAYELNARSDGRPVHLFKQSLILPFPSHQNMRTKNEVNTCQHNEKNTTLQTNITSGKSDKQAMAAREAYMLRLQRMLRERGVSLRHHYPEIYTKIAHFVESGIPFTTIRITFDDFLLQQQVNCIIQPMKDLYIEPVNQTYENDQNSKLLEINKTSNNIQQSKYIKCSKSQEKSLVNHQKLNETNF